MAAKPKDRGSDPAQYQLDFSSQIDDKRRRLRQALERTPGANLEKWTFLLWVCNIENDRAGLVRDYPQIAENLWCSRSTAIRMVNHLVDVGLVKVEQTFTADGDAWKNEYRVNWSMVDRITKDAIAKDFGVLVSPSHGDTTPSHGDTSLKEYIRIPDSSPVLVLDPEPEPESPSAEPRKAGQTEGSREPRKASLGEDRLRKALFDELPELREAAQRPLVPLPPGELLQRGVWRVITERHLKFPELLVCWHRRQLSLTWPVAGGTVADFLLVLAAAIHARTYQGAITKSREALFVSMVSRCLWDKCKYLVPQAVNTLHNLESRSPLGLDFSEAQWAAHTSGGAK